MEYRTGSYVVVGQKMRTCECCTLGIPAGQKQFIRVKESKELSYTSTGESFHRKSYQRWHIKCALGIKDLNDYEKSILSFFFLGLQSAQEAPESTNSGQKVA